MKTELPNIYEQAAGIDIGADKIFVCAKDGEYQVFRCFTEDFRKAAAYIKENGVSRVAMEATGVYWIALKDVLEQEGLVVDVVKAGDAKQLPGRDKTDGADCQWIRTLYQKGLLRPCVIPDAVIRELRTYVRMRQDHIEIAAQHVQQMQKALIQMNIRLPQVLSDIMGASGKRIIEAIIKGEKDPEKLVLLCDRQILKNKREEVVLALEGNYREDYFFYYPKHIRDGNFIMS
jgi:transposase